MTDKELIQEIRKYRCSDLSDGMDAIGLVDKGTMNENMRPIRPGIEFKGFAYTVKLLPKKDGVKCCSTIEEWREELGKGCNDIYHFVDEITPERAQDTVIVIDMESGAVYGARRLP